MFLILEILGVNYHANHVVFAGTIAPVLIVLMGLGMFAFWLFELKKNYLVLKSQSFIWKNEKGEKMWFHVSVELLTAVLLIVSGILLLMGKSIAIPLVLFAAGLLFYASLNSLSWVFAEKSRYKLAFPMIFGIILILYILLYCII